MHGRTVVKMHTMKLPIIFCYFSITLLSLSVRVCTCMRLYSWMSITTAACICVWMISCESIMNVCSKSTWNVQMKPYEYHQYQTQKWIVVSTHQNWKRNYKKKVSRSKPSPSILRLGRDAWYTCVQLSKGRRWNCQWSFVISVSHCNACVCMACMIVCVYANSCVLYKYLV